MSSAMMKKLIVTGVTALVAVAIANRIPAARRLVQG